MIDPLPYFICRYRFKPRNANEHNCWTLVRQVMKDHGRTLKDFPFCPDDKKEIAKAFDAEIKTGMSGMLRRIDGELQPLDIIVTKRKVKWLRLFHAGIMITKNKMLHITSESKTPMIDSIETLQEFSAWR